MGYSWEIPQVLVHTESTLWVVKGGSIGKSKV